MLPGAKLTLVHTRQHYDKAMSQVFFDQFDLRPDHVLKLHPVPRACSLPT